MPMHKFGNWLICGINTFEQIAYIYQTFITASFAFARLHCNCNCIVQNYEMLVDMHHFENSH